MKIEILVALAWVDITKDVLANNCRLRYAFGTEEFKYAPDTFDFSIGGENIQLIRGFLHSNKKVEVRVFADPVEEPDPNNPGQTIQVEKHLFQGDIQAGSNITIQDNHGDLALTCKDIADRLNRPCPALVHIDSDLQTIVREICNFANIQHNFPASMSAIQVAYLVREQDDEPCLRLLDNLLWEFGYTMYYDAVNGVSVRSWWFTDTQDNLAMIPPRIHRIIDDSLVKEPLEIDEEELDFDILTVEWTIAGNMQRDPTAVADGVCDDSDMRDNNRPSGIRLYLSTEENVAIAGGAYHPADGNLNLTYQRYIPRTAPDLFGGDSDRTKIIYAYDQCIEFVTTSGQIVIAIQDHGAQQSRVVFHNMGTQAEELTRWSIRGSAIFSQGIGLSTVAAFSESETFIVTLVDRGNPAQVVYQLPNSASDVDNFYVGYRIVSANGTNLIITGYVGTPFYRAIVSRPNEVSEFDADGTEVTLISPSEGVREEKVPSKNLYSQQEGNNLAEAIKNAKVLGRNTARFDMLESDNPPLLGEYIRFKYDLYGLDYIGVVQSYEYTPDDIDRPRVNLAVRGIDEFTPRRSYRAASLLFDPELPGENEGLAGTPGAAVETIYAETDSASIPANQRPLNSWGYRSPGTVGGLEWKVTRPNA